MWSIVGLARLENDGVIQLGRGRVISKKDMQAFEGPYPVYSAAKTGEGRFGTYGKYDFDEELITWSVDGGGRLFHRGRHKFSITNVTGFLRILNPQVLTYRFLYYALTHLHSNIGFDWVKKAHPSVLRKEYTSIPLPPLAEQKCIVERLDKAFAEIDKAIATAEAKEGEVEKLVSETIRQVFQRGGENKKKNFAEVCVLQRGFDLPKKDRSSGIYPLYSANGITDYISAPKVQGPAVITGRSGTIGKVHYSENDIWPLNTALYVKDFKGNFPKYVYYFLRSFNLKKYSSGTGVPTLNRNILKHELVYVCEGSDRQENKCRILDKIEGEVSKISHIQKRQLDLLRRLKASILKEELTPSEAV